MDSQKSGKKYRNLCFTWNNWNREAIDLLSTFVEDRCSYIIVGFEVGKCGTPHLQGYLELSKQTTFTTLKKMLPVIHFEERKGTATQARDYCKKSGHYIEHGSISIQGKRNDIARIRDMVNNNSTILDIMNDVNSFQAWKAAETYLKYKPLSTDYIKKTVIWIWGKSGTGKTKKAYTYIKEKTFWRSKSNLKWFDGYYGQEIVIIDDFRESHCSHSELLELLDGYEISVPVKGGFTIWRPKVVIITTPKKPEYYIPIGEQSTQLLRRITETIHF